MGGCEIRVTGSSEVCFVGEMQGKGDDLWAHQTLRRCVDL